MAEDAEKLACPLSSIPFFRVKCVCDGLVVVIVSSDVLHDPGPIHLLWNPSTREYYSGLSCPRVSSLVSFSISKEMYGEIPVSKEILLSFLGNNYAGVSVLDGMLCVNSGTGLMGVGSFKLWVLKDYGVKESWNALLTIEDPLIQRLLPKYRFADGEVLFYCAYMPSGDVRSLLRKKIPHGGSVFRTTASGPFVSWLQAGPLNGEAFTESLISPKFLFPHGALVGFNCSWPCWLYVNVLHYRIVKLSASMEVIVADDGAVLAEAATFDWKNWRIASYPPVHQRYLDRISPYVLYRWIGTAVLAIIYAFLIYVRGFYGLTLYIAGDRFMISLFKFLSAHVDPKMKEEGPLLSIKGSDEFKPLIRELPEIKFWYAATFDLCLAFAMAFYPIKDLEDVKAYRFVLLFMCSLLYFTKLGSAIYKSRRYKYNPFTLQSR
ncbi:protein RER1A [Capsicum annuum]